MPTKRAPGPHDIQPVANETADRIATGLVTVLPVIALGVAVWQSWSGLLKWHDIVVFTVMYVACGFGITVGFHRLLTHRSFKCKPWVRFTLAALGSMAVEGPVVSWVADHRKHHAFSDHHGDPHSPHIDHEDGFIGAVRGFIHAHVGWLFIHTQRAAKQRYAPDMLADPGIRFVNRTFVGWAILGFVLPFALGFALGGTLVAGLTGMLWGGLVRMFLLHHVTYSINSICHVFGRRRFVTDDHSRNVFWLAPLTFGESWHNNHHAFPTSAVHGMRRWDLDTSAMVIRGLEATGLAWDVVRISPERQARKAVDAPSRRTDPRATADPESATVS